MLRTRRRCGMPGCSGQALIGALVEAAGCLVDRLSLDASFPSTDGRCANAELFSDRFVPVILTFCDQPSLGLLDFLSRRNRRRPVFLCPESRGPPKLVGKQPLLESVALRLEALELSLVRYLAAQLVIAPTLDAD